MTRVIAGTAKGRPLKVPKSGTRPTSDRVRESVFTSLNHRLGGFEDLAVLDLFAGSGAFALEAMSRGARLAVAVESAKAAAMVISENSKVTGLPVEVRVEDAIKMVKQKSRATFDLVFIDPPYDLDGQVVDSLVADLVSGGWLARGAVIVVERSERSPGPVEPADCTSFEHKKYGETGVWLIGW